MASSLRTIFVLCCAAAAARDGIHQSSTNCASLPAQSGPVVFLPDAPGVECCRLKKSQRLDDLRQQRLDDLSVLLRCLDSDNLDAVMTRIVDDSPVLRQIADMPDGPLRWELQLSECLRNGSQSYRWQASLRRRLARHYLDAELIAEAEEHVLLLDGLQNDSSYSHPCADEVVEETRRLTEELCRRLNPQSRAEPPL